jgi:large subunit ribosomal protein L1
MKHGKKYNESKKLVDSTKLYSIADAVALIKKTAYAKFWWSVDIAINTLANPKFNDQMIRATTVLPHGTGKSKKIAVYVGDANLDDAKKSWADIVGSDTLIADIKNGKIDFDVLITTPESIKDLAPVAKALWPKGLMPSPKSGTVTTNIIQAVDEFKKGKIEFKLDKTSNIHAPVGKISFDAAQLEANIAAFIKAVEDARPAGVKGKLIKKIVVSATMGPWIQVAY